MGALTTRNKLCRTLCERQKADRDTRYAYPVYTCNVQVIGHFFDALKRSVLGASKRHPNGSKFDLCPDIDRMLVIVVHIDVHRRAARLAWPGTWGPSWGPSGGVKHSVGTILSMWVVEISTTRARQNDHFGNGPKNGLGARTDLEHSANLPNVSQPEAAEQVNVSRRGIGGDLTGCGERATLDSEVRGYGRNKKGIECKRGGCCGGSERGLHSAAGICRQNQGPSIGWALLDCRRHGFAALAGRAEGIGPIARSFFVACG